MLAKLQNGTDVRGISLPGVAGEAVNFTETEANVIAQAFVCWLAQKTGKKAEELKIGVGQDSRLSGKVLKKAILAGITGAGAQGVDCKMASTPAMFMSTVYDEFRFDGSIMVTASHLPFNRNGMKFFDLDGGLEKPDIKAILAKAEELSSVYGDWDRMDVAELIDSYSAHLVDYIRKAVAAEDFNKPLAGLKVVVDCGNGAGGFFVDKVLNPLGADTTGSQFLDPDGNFPNHIPNPEDKAAMASIRAAVVENKADLGIIFDTDVDRMSAVLSDGTEVNRDAIIAMMAAILKEEYPGSTIVTDSVTSDRLKVFLEDVLGMKQHRFQRGYKNVINECKRLNAEGIVSPLAIETSGHGALKDNYYLDDGAFMAVKLLIFAAKAKAEGKALGSYIEALAPAVEECEVRMKIAGEDFKEYGAMVLENFEKKAREKGYAVAENSYEGVRISFNSEEAQGWLLLRMSLHDPLLPLNIEGGRVGDCDKIKKIVADLMSDFDRVDRSKL